MTFTFAAWLTIKTNIYALQTAFLRKAYFFTNLTKRCLLLKKGLLFEPGFCLKSTEHPRKFTWRYFDVPHNFSMIFLQINYSKPQKWFVNKVTTIGCIYKKTLFSQPANEDPDLASCHLHSLAFLAVAYILNKQEYFLFTLIRRHDTILKCVHNLRSSSGPLRQLLLETAKTSESSSTNPRSGKHTYQT